MITFNLQNLSAIDSAHGLSKAEIESHKDKISNYLAKIDSRDQGFYTEIDNEETRARVIQCTNNVKDKFEYFVILGIGGSSLGAICLQQALGHLYKRNLFVLDNIDPEMLREIEDVIDLEKTLFLTITKSGNTPETLSQYFYFRKRIEDQGLNFEDHFLTITDSSDGLLTKIALETENVDEFEMPLNVGGRFSVLTSVGLIPAGLMGFDVEKLLHGAKKMRNQFLNPKFEENLPFQLATIQYLLEQKGKTMNVMIPYAQKLEKFADWYRQLLAESIGKAVNEKGETVNIGITPIKALGVTDQHSQAQLYNEGPNDKLFMFLSVLNHGPELDIPNPYPNEESVDFLKGVSFNKLLATEMQGTIQSLTQNNRPNITIEIPEINEETLGALFMLFEAATAFLGEFYEIDAFNQPGVELSKQLTRKMLSE